MIFAIGFTIYTLNDIQNKYAGEPTEKRIISTASRYLCGIGNDSLKIRTEFIVTKTMTDSLTEYDYKSKTDSTRNLKLRYWNYSQKLYFDQTEYRISEREVLRDEQNPEIWFDNYEMSEPIIDGMSPLIFNPDYGILAITGPLNPPLLFMSKSNDKIYADRIMEVLWK